MKQAWIQKTLQEACIINPQKKEAMAKASEEDLVSFLPMEDLGILQRDVVASKERFLKDVFKSYTYFGDNDILLAKITPCFENGKLGIVRKLKNGVGFGSSEFLVFRPKEEVTPDYVFYYLSKQSFRQEGKKLMTGAVGHKRVSKEFVYNSVIALPPIGEQQRIVAILDQAFAAIAKAKQNAEKNLQNAKELFDTYLQGLFENRGEGWETKTLSEISENLDSKRIPITKNIRKGGTIPYYGASGVVDFVADHIFDEDLLCISEDGANLLARTYPIAFSISGKSWVNNHAHVLRFKNRFTQKFIEIYLNSIKLNDFISGMAQPKLNQTMLNKIPVPLPPEREQIMIVNKLEALASNTKRLQSIYQQKLSNLEELKKSILQKAFAGELTNKEIQELV